MDCLQIFMRQNLLINNLVEPMMLLLSFDF